MGGAGRLQPRPLGVCDRSQSAGRRRGVYSGGGPPAAAGGGRGGDVMECGRQVANFGAGPAKLPRSVSRGRGPFPARAGAGAGARRRAGGGCPPGASAGGAALAGAGGFARAPRGLPAGLRRRVPAGGRGAARFRLPARLPGGLRRAPAAKRGLGTLGQAVARRMSGAGAKPPFFSPCPPGSVPWSVRRSGDAPRGGGVSGLPSQSFFSESDPMRPFLKGGIALGMESKFSDARGRPCRVPYLSADK